MQRLVPQSSKTIKSLGRSSFLKADRRPPDQEAPLNAGNRCACIHKWLHEPATRESELHTYVPVLDNLLPVNNTPHRYVKCDGMAKRAVDAVKNKELRIEPAMHEKTWYQWLDNSRDW